MAQSGDGSDVLGGGSGGAAALLDHEGHVRTSFTMQCVTLTLEAHRSEDEVVAVSGEGAKSRRRLPRWAAPVLLFFVARAVGMLLMARVASLRGWSLVSRLTEWDGHWFVSLAQYGYESLPAGLYDAHYHLDAFTGYAFFPGYPALISLLSELPMATPAKAAVGISVVASLFAAAGVARLGELAVPQSLSGSAGGRRFGLLLVVLFAAAPMGIVLWMAYSEALFCALAVWALAGIMERRWLLAGLCAFAAGLVRPTALAVIVVLIVAVLVKGRRDGARAWLAAAAAPTGMIGYIAWVSVRTHDVAGWFDVQRRGWGTATDFGKATLVYLNAVLVEGREIVDAGTALIIVAALVLLVVLLAQRWPWELKLYGALMFASAATSAGLMHCRPRLLLPIFVLALPLAKALAQARPRTQWLVGAGAVLLSAWFGSYMVAIFPHSI
ncbi:MAG: tat pathway signal sequence [Segniliparus sp.]|uniref:tat pathway signal sequence n=1 Tax=Segniliparus sp. TaxID=2804064 RepID=UPI003F314D39